MAKSRAFGNNIIFLQQFFNFGGGGTFPLFPLPLAAPMQIYRSMKIRVTIDQGNNVWATIWVTIYAYCAFDMVQNSSNISGI